MKNYDAKDEFMKLQFKTEFEDRNFDYKEEWARAWCELNTWRTPKELKEHPFFQDGEKDPIKIYLREQIRHSLMNWITMRIGEKRIFHYWNVKFRANGMSEKEFKKWWFWNKIIGEKILFWNKIK